MRFRRAAAIAAWALALATPLAAAQPQVQPIRHVSRFTTDDGLAQNLVLSVVQDRAGFLWVGTRRGLQRFDGTEFASWESLAPQGDARLSDLIRNLVIDRHGQLWVVTPDAVFRMDPRSLRSSLVLEHEANAIAIGPQDRIWFIADGALHWIHADSAGRGARTAARDAAWTNVSVLSVAAGGTVWMALDEDGTIVARFDPATSQIRSWDVPDVRAPLALTEDDAGRLWLSAESGLAVLEPGAPRFTVLDAFAGQRTVGPQADGRGGLLIATDDWLARVDATGRITDRWTSAEVFGVGALVMAIATDREAGIWLGTTTLGLLRLDTRGSVFEHRSSASNPPLPLGSDFVTALYERRDGTLWVGTLRGGASAFGSDWRVVQSLRHDPRVAGTLGSNEVWDFEEDAHGNLWIATAGGICGVRPEAVACHRHADNPVADIAKDGAGMFWLALFRGGLARFDPATGRFLDVLPAVGASSTESMVLAVLAEPAARTLWIGGSGVYRLSIDGGRATGPLEKVASDGDRPATVVAFHRDRRGDLWAATDNGLQRLDGKTGAFLAVPVSALRASTVFSIAEDETGRLWLGTAHGLVEYAPDTGSSRRYARADGFLSGEANRRAALHRRQGTLLFGGVEGLTEFDPRALLDTRTDAVVAFTRWSRVTPGGALDAAVTADTVRIEPGDRAFTVEFAALSYAPAIGRRYRYRLDPLNADWIESTERRVTYPTPRPGRYTLRVETAAGSAGLWSAPGATLVLDVLPPFWATAWFRTLVLLTIAILLWAAHRFRLRNALAAERLRLRISRDLHDELGAGLSGIALLSDASARAETLDDAERSQLRRIGSSARAMVADLREIVWTIDPQADRLNDVITRMKDLATDLLGGIRLTFHAPSDHELAARIGMAERRDLMLLYKEILNNIAKHARATDVHIAVVLHRTAIELTVKDDGVGFDPDSTRPGTGLKSLRERAARLGGQLEVASRPGGGTRIRVLHRRT